MDLQQTRIIYVGDPMCSWCWGISGELRQLVNTYPEFPFELVVGGLRPHETHPMSPKMKQEIKNHWLHVQQMTQRPFRFEFLEEDNDFVYATEKACRAVVVVRKMAPELAFPFFEEVQRAFYQFSHDPNQIETYDPILEKLKLDRDTFRELFTEESIRKETSDDFMWSKQVGVKGFPTVLMVHQGQLFAVSMGYSDFATMDRIVKRILG